MSSLKINKSRICLGVLPYWPNDVIRKGQFALEELPLKSIKKFIRALFGLNIQGAYTWFDKLDCKVSIRREDDKDMTLDKFLSLLTSKGFIRLQTGDPNHDQIRFMARNWTKDDGVERFAWFECKLTTKSYKKVDEEFKKAFGFCLREIC